MQYNDFLSYTNSKNIARFASPICIPTNAAYIISYVDIQTILDRRNLSKQTQFARPNVSLSKILSLCHIIRNDNDSNLLHLLPLRSGIRIPPTDVTTSPRATPCVAVPIRRFDPSEKLEVGIVLGPGKEPV